MRAAHQSNNDLHSLSLTHTARAVRGAEEMKATKWEKSERERKERDRQDDKRLEKTKRPGAELWRSEQSVKAR